MVGNRAKGLKPMDVAAFAYLVIVAAVVVVFRERVPRWPMHAAAHLGAAVLIRSLIVVHDRQDLPLLRLLRFWYPVLLIPLIFKLNGLLVPKINPSDLDMQLLALDRTLFGRHPATFFGWMESPWMTEVLRLCWMSYFVLPFTVAVPIYRRAARSNGEITPFLVTVFALSAGWYLSYLGYFLTPAIGPGYYPELVGAPPARESGVTDAMLGTLWVLEGDTVRDICPSGHVIIAVLSLWAGFRYRLAIRWLIAPIVLGLVVGTVYLRFHYGVDVLAGLIIALVVAVAAPVLHPPPQEEAHAP